LDFLKKNDTFIPYLNERGNAGRSEIDSVKNIVMKKGGMIKMRLIEHGAKMKNKQINAAKVNKNSLKGLGILQFGN